MKSSSAKNSLSTNNMKFSADQEKKKNTSLRLNKQTLKALKIRAIEQDTSIQSLVENLIEDYLATKPK
jgi:predicted DNA binding CopG/RHH family protein